ncbi:26S proteasome non-ATPase regulatory subunit 9 [Calliphora vicina]|uniref:26S proteasome non-ATPase regulatory subunit 9 n=1 Tax=Calliphora vicina TaxID=7373 RepID=UPI00325ACA04
MVVPNSNPLETKLFKLMSDKDKLETQINTYGVILSQNDNVGMTGPLIDTEGFPRNDIDVHQVRQARQQIICLQNDHKALMKEIEKLMHELHAEAKQAHTSQQLSHKAAGMDLNNSSSDDSEEMSDALPQKPFLKVKNVSVGSPAEEAGLRINDEISEFGSANANNFNKKLETIANIVKHMHDRRIPLKVLRNNEILNLILIPHTWSGPGLLGCNVDLFDN